MAGTTQEIHVEAMLKKGQQSSFEANSIEDLINRVSEFYVDTRKMFDGFSEIYLNEVSLTKDELNSINSEIDDAISDLIKFSY